MYQFETGFSLSKKQQKQEKEIKIAIVEPFPWLSFIKGEPECASEKKLRK